MQDHRLLTAFPDQPLISIVLPVYNRNHLVMRAIASVMSQTFADWELLIVDDGSTDGLSERVLPLLRKDRRWRYLAHANRKLAASRNIGIHAALGDWVTFLDSDDEYRPDHLALRWQYVQAHPGVDVLHGGVELIGAEETHYVMDAFKPGEKIHLSQCVIGATLFGRKKCLVESRGFKALPYSAESEYLPRLQSAYHVEKVDFPTYVYYTGLPDSICSQVKKDKKF